MDMVPKQLIEKEREFLHYFQTRSRNKIVEIIIFQIQKIFDKSLLLSMSTLCPKLIAELDYVNMVAKIKCLDFSLEMVRDIYSRTL